LLQEYDLYYFNDFETNPNLNDALKGLEYASSKNIEMIISVGGGSVIDMSKIIKSLYLNPSNAEEIAKGLKQVNDPKIPMISIPTTSGSGSESTHFAVVYVNDEKYSIANNCLKPDEVILDGTLTLSSSKYQKTCSALDALSQSIESAWAVNSTHESQSISFKALKKCFENFNAYISSDDVQIAQNILVGANLAGQAINISKTTSAHAWSYAFTKRHEIPHGHAVWLTLPKIFEIYSKSTEDKIADPRGHEHLLKTINTIKDTLRIKNDTTIENQLKDFLKSADIKFDLINDLNLSLDERDFLSKQVNKERMANSPINFSHDDIDEIFHLRH
jgi:alcohol dehydrogenase class IV